MTILTTTSLESNKRVKINFDGGDLSSDAGLLLIKEFAARVGLISLVKKTFKTNDTASFRFHVTHLNIAQVKRKYGIIERENYNKPKSEDSRQPGCPAEKIRAIEEALMFFRMI